MPRLLSVNVGLPRDIAWHGETVRTAAWKEPVQGPRMVRRLNIDGDGQGDLVGHGGVYRAVFVYQIEAYHYWERQLGRHDFVFGQFGENFTVDGLSDDEVCIGDQYRIGSVLFVVTQPRVTCYRQGLGPLAKLRTKNEKAVTRMFGVCVGRQSPPALPHTSSAFQQGFSFFMRKRGSWPNSMVWPPPAAAHLK